MRIYETEGRPASVVSTNDFGSHVRSCARTQHSGPEWNILVQHHEALILSACTRQTVRSKEKNNEEGHSFRRRFDCTVNEYEHRYCLGYYRWDELCVIFRARDGCTDLFEAATAGPVPAGRRQELAITAPQRQWKNENLRTPRRFLSPAHLT
jgi:hypothetical protein